jgi:hypothetical protein
VLTGVVTVSAVAVPLALRPWSDNRTRRTKRQEEKRERWEEDARALSVELEAQLEKYQVGSLFSQSTLVMAPWEPLGGLRTRAAVILRFAPTDAVRKVGVELLEKIDLLHHNAFALLTLRRNHPDLSSVPRAQESYERYQGEAVYKLAQFVEALGGPTAPRRDAFTLPLKSDP